MQISSCLQLTAPASSCCSSRPVPTRAYQAPLPPAAAATASAASKGTNSNTIMGRRELMQRAAVLAMVVVSAPAKPVLAVSDEEYVKETSDVIKKVRNTISMDKTDPNVANAVAELREASNSWVAKYRREKALLGRTSFRDMYSALNAVSGHYVSFGPTAPIPAKRKARILEEVDTAEKSLLRGR